MTVLDHLAAYRVTRPARALVLVPLPDAVPWQAAMMAALRGQAATWAGSANLVVPWTDDLLEREALWRIAAALDPDVIAVARLAGSDLAGIVGEGDPLLGVGDELGRVERSEFEAVLREFGERLPVVQRMAKRDRCSLTPRASASLVRQAPRSVGISAPRPRSGAAPIWTSG